MKSMPRFAPAKGFSLVELMIAVVAGLIVSGAVLSFFLSSMKSNGEYVQSTRLTQELRNSLDLMVRDLERAGYDDDSLAYLATGTATPFTGIQLAKVNVGDPSLDCVMYAYDKFSSAAGSAPGALDLGNGEVRGIRLVSTTNQSGKTVGVVEYATSFGTTRPNCTGGTAVYTSYPPTCNTTSGWCALSDPSVLDISALALADNTTLSGSSPNQVYVRRIGIDMTGRLAGTTVPTRNMTASVRVRSDCYKPALANCLVSP